VAFPIAQSQQSLAALRFILIAGCILAILVAFLLGWVFAGTALDPIHRITQTARAIAVERDVSRRVAYDGLGDEVGQLTITFNDMLAELEAAYLQLEGSLESQKRFVADASHELRTPLTTVRGNIELLRRQPPILQDERAEILSETTDEVDRLIRLVTQLLVLARADAGQELQIEALPAQPLLEETCRMARSLAPDRELTCDAEPDAVALANRDALKQVLLILLDNAARHTQPRSAVQVRAERDGDRVAICVSDDGPGIAPSALPHIFDRFYRGDAARSGGGAGLGLAIAKELVELQSGTIAVASAPGQGTTFTVRLPAGNL
jgi:signal transduction histidine kinase